MPIQGSINAVLSSTATVSAIKGREEKREAKATETREHNRVIEEARQKAVKLQEEKLEAQKSYQEKNVAAQERVAAVKERNQQFKEEQAAAKERRAAAKVGGIMQTRRNRVQMMQRGLQAAQDSIDEKVQVQENKKNRFLTKAPFPEGGTK